MRPNINDIYSSCLINQNMVSRIHRAEEVLNSSKEFILDVADGVHRSVLVYGPPGLGKTHLIQNGLESKGLVLGKDFLIARSHITPRQFYAMLYLMREEGKFIVLDDCDGVMSNEEGLNLLKAATDPTFRTVGWSSSSGVKLPNGLVIPDDFEFNGSVIIATNISQPKKGKQAQHFAAIRSRCVPWNLDFSSAEDRFAYIFHMIVEHDYLASQTETTLTWGQKIDLVKFLMSNLSLCTDLDLRKPQHIARVIRSKPNNWQNQARHFLTAV